MATEAQVAKFRVSIWGISKGTVHAGRDVVKPDVGEKPFDPAANWPVKTCLPRPAQSLVSGQTLVSN